MAVAVGLSCSGCSDANKTVSQTTDTVLAEQSGTMETGNADGLIVTEEAQKDKSGRYLLSDKGEAVINDVAGDPYEATGDDNARVFYHIFVGSFSDSNGDGVGDLRGIINRFDYLNDGDPDSGLSLGVEGIWLSPVFESPTYHKYDTTDYYKIDESFGTMDDLRELVALCHERNVKLILDLVLNHTGDRNEWFKSFCSAHRHSETENEYYDFYTYNDSISKGSRHFLKIPSGDEFYECNFSSNMPELNFDNPKVYETMLEVARYYLEDIGVDGFRFDAAKYIYYGEEPKNVEFWTRYMADLKKIKPDIYTVAEVWDSDSLTTKYAPALNCFNFTMAQVDGMIAQTTKRGDVNLFVRYLGSYIDTITELNPSAMPVSFIANHDTDRAAGYMTVASGYAKMAANLLLLCPGSSFIYYGEEIGEKGSRGAAATDANRRLAMLWGDGDTVKDPEGTTFDPGKQTNGDVAGLLSDGDGLLNYYKRLIMIRKANPEIARGEFTALKFEDTRAGGFLSTWNGKTVGVFHNTTGSTVTLDLSQATDIQLTVISAVAGIGAENVKLEGTLLTIGEQTSVVLR